MRALRWWADQVLGEALAVCVLGLELLTRLPRNDAMLGCAFGGKHVSAPPRPGAMDGPQF
eukprot:scaffold111981_cov75-Phaeocystis_antarctica.AAC.2